MEPSGIQGDTQRIVSPVRMRDDSDYPAMNRWAIIGRPVDDEATLPIFLGAAASEENSEIP